MPRCILVRRLRLLASLPVLLDLQENLILTFRNSFYHGDFVKYIIDHDEIRRLFLNSLGKVALYAAQDVLILAVATRHFAALSYVLASLRMYIYRGLFFAEGLTT